MTEDWVHGVGHSPVCQTLLQIVVRAVITSSPPAWTSFAGMLSTPADFHFFVDCMQPQLLCEGWGGHPLCLSGDSSVLMDFHRLFVLYSSEQYSAHRFSTCRSSVRHSPERSSTVFTFPSFTVVKSFTSLYALLLLFFLKFS